MGLFSSILKSFVPTRRKRKKRRTTTVRGEGFRPSDSGAGAKIMLAEPFGSGGKDVAARLSAMLGPETVFQTVRIDKVLKQNIRLGMLERLVSAGHEGAGWLKQEKADLLIWGEMEDMGTVARLRFLVNGGGGDGQPGTFGLADSLAVPVPVPEAMADMIRAVAVAAVLPVARGARQDLAERLKKLLASAEKALETRPKDAHAEHKMTVESALANAYGTAFRFGDKKALAGALKHFEIASEYVDAEKSPLQWALVHTHWATVLEADARVRKDPAALEAAAKRYRDVAETLSRDVHGNDWALAHVRRAMALYRLASLVPEKTMDHLKSAATDFEEALTVYDRGAMPLRWAEVMNHHGVVQMALGGYVTGNAMLQQSISTFRSALEVRKRESQPMLWAQTANNLGAACFALAKRTKEEHLLEEAAACFEGAIDVYRRTPGQKKRAAVIANNLGRVRFLLGDEVG